MNKSVCCSVALGTLVFAASCAHTGGTKADDFQRDFPEDKSDLMSAGTNPYFILEPGWVAEYAEFDNASGETLTITVTEETLMVDGVETRIVEERESKNGKVIEISQNYFAIGRKTNSVYYFGEDSQDPIPFASRDERHLWRHHPRRIADRDVWVQDDRGHGMGGCASQRIDDPRGNGTCDRVENNRGQAVRLRLCALQWDCVLFGGRIPCRTVATPLSSPISSRYGRGAGPAALRLVRIRRSGPLPSSRDCKNTIDH